MAEIETYSLVEILHIVAVISWLAGLLYLPRIFVYHTQVAVGSESDKIFQTMERKLLRYIMNPAMIVVICCGLYMASEIGFNQGWLHAKLTLVSILVIFHHLLGRWRKNFEKGQNKHSQKFFRMMNEVPTIAMICIVTLVVLKPF
jgi:protoporphyrinogen IX oxidase